MRFTMLLVALLTILGLLGAWVLSAFFFGFFTLGLFLFFYDRMLKREEMPFSTSRPHSENSLTTNLVSGSYRCSNCGMVLDASGAFCPRCGEKVKTE